MLYVGASKTEEEYGDEFSVHDISIDSPYTLANLTEVRGQFYSSPNDTLYLVGSVLHSTYNYLYKMNYDETLTQIELPEIVEGIDSVKGVRLIAFDIYSNIYIANENHHLLKYNPSSMEFELLYTFEKYISNLVVTKTGKVVVITTNALAECDGVWVSNVPGVFNLIPETSGIHSILHFRDDVMVCGQLYTTDCFDTIKTRPLEYSHPFFYANSRNILNGVGETYILASDGLYKHYSEYDYEGYNFPSGSGIKHIYGENGLVYHYWNPPSNGFPWYSVWETWSERLGCLSQPVTLPNCDSPGENHSDWQESWDSPLLLNGTLYAIKAGDICKISKYNEHYQSMGFNYFVFGIGKRGNTMYISTSQNGIFKKA
jgi:hypothetical protein